MNATLSETYLTEVDFLIAQAEKDKQAAVQAATQATAYATRLETQREFARKLILKNWTSAEIAATINLDAAEVEALRREMTAHAM